MARLIVNPGTPNLWEIRLKDGVNALGRVETNDATINDASVSGHHCEVIVSGESVRLKDLGSTNGTFVNRVPITESVLESGQRIQLGSVELLFEADGAPGVASAVSEPPLPPPMPPSPGRIRIAGVVRAPAPAPVETESEPSFSDGPPVP